MVVISAKHRYYKKWAYYTQENEGILRLCAWESVYVTYGDVIICYKPQVIIITNGKTGLTFR